MVGGKGRSRGRFSRPRDALATIAVLDGKAASAVDHPVVKELAMSKGKFEPVCFGFVDPAEGTGSSANQLATLLHGLKTDRGVDRVDLQWGFEGDALMSVMRLVSAKPRKGLLAAVDGPTFNKASLLPLPDQVKSFVVTSVNPRHFVELIKQMAPSDEGKEQVEEVAKSVKGKAPIDIEKDVLGQLGPRMIAYVAGRSAVTDDDAVGSAFKGGLSLSGMMTAMQSNFPKLTIVSEVKNPEAFGKGLDALIVAINGKLKEQAVAKAKEEREEAEKKDEASTGTGVGGGGGRGGAAGRAGGGGGGDRTKTRRGSPSQTTAPRFELTSSSGKSKLFILSTPRTSPLQFGPSSFKPTVEFDGERVAFAVSPDAAKNALATARKKDWKPSSDLAKALENVENNAVLLAVSDVSDTLPGVLASLPGTLQTMLNTTWTLAKAKAGTEAGASQPTTPGGAGGVQGVGALSRRSGMAMPGGGMQTQGGGGRTRGGLTQGAANQTTGAGSNTGGAAGDSAIVFNIDAQKLPKASDLKAYLFPSTVTISVTDQDIRIVSREAFPDLGSLINSLPVLGMTAGGKALVNSAKAPDPAATGGAAGGAAGAAPAGRRRGGPNDKGDSARWCWPQGSRSKPGRVILMYNEAVESIRSISIPFCLKLWRRRSRPLSATGVRLYRWRAIPCNSCTR